VIIGILPLVRWSEGPGIEISPGSLAFCFLEGDRLPVFFGVLGEACVLLILRWQRPHLLSVDGRADNCSRGRVPLRLDAAEELEVLQVLGGEVRYRVVLEVGGAATRGSKSPNPFASLLLGTLCLLISCRLSRGYGSLRCYDGFIGAHRLSVYVELAIRLVKALAGSSFLPSSVIVAEKPVPRYLFWCFLALCGGRCYHAADGAKGVI
jgi:hypothetical protein